MILTVHEGLAKDSHVILPPSWELDPLLPRIDKVPEGVNPHFGILRHKGDDENDTKYGAKGQEQLEFNAQLVKVFQAEVEQSDGLADNSHAEAHDEESSIEVIEKFAEQLKVEVALQIQLRYSFTLPNPQYFSIMLGSRHSIADKLYYSWE